MASTSPDSPSPNAAREQRFGADGSRYGTEPNEFLREYVGSLPPGRVLCVAEGEGRNAVFLASQGVEVSSIDLTEAGVAKTRRIATQRGVNVDAVPGDLATVDPGISHERDCVDLRPPAARDSSRSPPASRGCAGPWRGLPT
jgi:Tellurite resistance protein TehB